MNINSLSSQMECTNYYSTKEPRLRIFEFKGLCFEEFKQQSLTMLRIDDAQRAELEVRLLEQPVTRMPFGSTISSGMTLIDGRIMNAVALWSESTSPENPTVLVKGHNTDRSVFEMEVNINKVDPRNATIIEMLALRGYFNATDKAVSIWTPLSIDGDISTRFDFIASIEEQVEVHRYQGNLLRYDILKKQIEALMDHIARIENLNIEEKSYMDVTTGELHYEYQ